MDHIGQIIALIGLPLAALLTALARWLNALSGNLADNNKGQNAALTRLEARIDELAKARGLPASPPPPPAPRRARRASRLYPRQATPLPFFPPPIATKPETPEEP